MKRNSDFAKNNKFQYYIFIKLFFGLSVLLVLTYLGISAYAAHILSKATRCFNREKRAVFVTPPQDVKFRASDRVEISGWFIPQATVDKAVILVHGLNVSRTCEFAGKFAEFASAMNQKGFSILTIDLRGHGQSNDSRFTFGITERRDIIAAVEWLKAEGFEPKKIGVLGVSMGSASVIGAAAENSDIGAVVIDSGYAEVYPVIQKHWQSASGLPQIFLPSTMMFGALLTGYDLSSSKPVQEIGRISPKPVLIIHSRFDPYTPVINAYQLKTALTSAEYWETTASEHAGNYAENPQIYVKKVADFFQKSLK
ncbi:MAG: alpha/beta hydrolase [Actinomycetota bacterium]